MNFKKKILVVPIILSIMLISILQITVNASTSETRYFGITTIRNRGNEGLGYAIGNPNQGGSPLWNIRSYPSEGASSPNTTHEALYCLRAGFGFLNVNSKQKYDTSYDMLTERDEIASLGSGNDSELYSKLVNGGQYNNILALLDLMYIPEKSTTQEREQLLENALDDEYRYQLTDDDIEATQQAALWYFTNGQLYSQADKYDKYGDSAWMNYTKDGSGTGTYSAFSGYYGSTGSNREEGSQRNEQMCQLYDYLVDTAKANAGQYGDAQKLGEPLTITSDSMSRIKWR